MRKSLEIPLSAIQSYLDRNITSADRSTTSISKLLFTPIGWPGQNFYLRVRLNAAPLPQLSNWYRGDIHYHSGYTDNPAERGYPLSVTRQAALDAGLNWLVLADHSTDLSEEDFARELQEVRAYRDGRFVFIRGEEVTVSSNKTIRIVWPGHLAHGRPAVPR